jgi:GntR family transcriptional regulator
MKTSIVISQSDGRPMYLQIMEQIRQRVVLGEWKPGEQIPSIRAMAIALQISVITVKRAYLELEREGVIVTQHGKGSVVASDPDSGSRLYDEELEEHLRQVVRIGTLLGLTEREIVERLREAAVQLETEAT